MSLFKRSRRLKRKVLGGRSHLSVGDVAPELELMSTDSERVTVASLRGAPWVLYFYPKDQTSGCTRQACDIRDNWAAVQSTGARLFGVSLDDLASHGDFIRAHGLPFPLLSDPDALVARRYGVLAGVGPLKAARRVTFVVNANGNIASILDPAATNGHSQQVLAALKEISA